MPSPSLLSHVLAGAGLAEPGVPDAAAGLGAALADHVFHALVGVVAAERRGLVVVHAGDPVGGPLGAAARVGACPVFIGSVQFDSVGLV